MLLYQFKHLGLSFFDSFIWSLPSLPEFLDIIESKQNVWKFIRCKVDMTLIH